MVQKIITTIIVASAVVLLGLFLTGCYTQKKADKQVNKALYKHPAVVAHVARFAFPCVTTTIDSSEFKSSINKLDSLLNETRIDAVEKAGRLKEVQDSLEKALKRNRDTSFSDCAEENKGLIAYASRLQVDNEKQKAGNSQKEKIIDELQYQIAHIKPIIKKEKDSAEVYLAIKDAAAAHAAAAKSEAKYQAKSIEADTYKAQRNKARKINWILFFLIGAFVGWQLRRFILGIGNIKFFGSNK